MYRREMMAMAAALVLGLATFSGVRASSSDAMTDTDCTCCGAACICPACVCDDAKTRAGQSCDCCGASACCATEAKAATVVACCR